MTDAVDAAASALLRALVDKLPAMVAYWDTDLRCQFANRAYEKWFGIKPEAMVGSHISEVLGPLYALNLPHVEGALRGEAQLFEREIPDPAGGPPRYSQAQYIPDVVDGTVRGFCVLVTDITRRKQAEEALHKLDIQLRATERLAAMATLAAGIAHEINNPLAAVIGNLDLVVEYLNGGKTNPAELRADVVDARDGARRVAEIVKSMKLLARGETARTELVDVNETLERSVGIAWNAIRYRAHLVRDLGDAGYVSGNSSQLAQVFVNLLVNAAQAFPEDRFEGNEIKILTRLEGKDVVVEVADNGCGIPEGLQSRIFEPFFTTKDVGVGTGLGLSVSSGIVNALGGRIAVSSKVGEGSVFRVVLPAAAPQAAPAKVLPSEAAAREAASAARPTGTRPRVLIVDDEPPVARVLQHLIGRECDVTVVHGGRAAITALSKDPPPFDLVICDLMMPVVTGADVYKEVTKARPELAPRFVFMTGGAFTQRGQEFLDSVQAPILEKPFDVAQVRSLVAARRP